jgi:hypothetical protein
MHGFILSSLIGRKGFSCLLHLKGTYGVGAVMNITLLGVPSSSYGFSSSDCGLALGEATVAFF